jgi:hypothetical protein
LASQLGKLLNWKLKKSLAIQCTLYWHIRSSLRVALACQRPAKCRSFVQACALRWLVNDG